MYVMLTNYDAHWHRGDIPSGLLMIRLRLSPVGAIVEPWGLLAMHCNE